MYIRTSTFIDKDEASLAALDMIDESHLFVWDGVSVGGEAVEVGECCEPVQLHVMYPSLGGEGEGSVSETEMVLGFSKNSTLREIKVCTYMRTEKDVLWQPKLPYLRALIPTGL